MEIVGRQELIRLERWSQQLLKEVSEDWGGAAYNYWIGMIDLYHETPSISDGLLR